MFYALVVTLHIIVSLFLVLVVLLQTGKGGDLASAFGGGGTQTVFGPRGTSNVLTRATTVAAVLFICTSLGLVMMTQGSQKSVLDEVAAPEAAITTEQTATPEDTLGALEETPALDEEQAPENSVPAGEN